MKYFKIFFTAAVLGSVLLTSCNEGKIIRINGTVKDLPQEASLVLKRLDFTTEAVLDTLAVREGEVSVIVLKRETTCPVTITFITAIKGLQD
jgi:hypothetical protein